MGPDGATFLDARAVRPRLGRKADGALRLHAAAKVNLSLSVGAPRPDGYHPLDSLVARISLYDVLTLAPAAEGIRFTCEGLSCGPDEENLAVRAARALARAAPSAGPRGADVRLTKHIPPGARRRLVGRRGRPGRVERTVGVELGPEGAGGCGGRSRQ